MPPLPHVQKRCVPGFIPLGGLWLAVFDDVIHPGEEFVQVVVAAVRYLPRHGEIHGFAAVGQFACEDDGDGVRGVAVGGANADAPVLRRGFIADVVQRVHLFDGHRICHAGAGDAAVCLAVGGEVPLIFAGAAEECFGVMDKTGAFFETWDSNGQNGCFLGYPFAK